MILDILGRWPLLQQIRTGADGTGPEAMTQRTRELRPKTDNAQVARSICPYCGVGCGQLAYHKNGKLISIDTRDRTFEETRDGHPVMHTTAMAHLGGATLDNEENYVIRKLFTAGLGMVCVSNQARI